MSRATLWRNGVPSNLGALQADHTSGAYGINNAGQVVGYSLAPLSGAGRATLWANGCIYDLNGMVDLSGRDLTLVQASAINHRGQIVGFGMTSSRETRAVLLTPINSSTQAYGDTRRTTPPCTRPAM